MTFVYNDYFVAYNVAVVYEREVYNKCYTSTFPHYFSLNMLLYCHCVEYIC